ncbi:piggyBac transposable element-derived protein 4 [Nephila pilipes]|uniref:PiggyBac transposable element-derived protein 4 n=1 Tax=Nephila pilipes TaxID=299642 RepID=A0A8X6P8Y7_NEPPI|nr:piggyBac transposable element-derived protein 4 [Nephila pilipes]
MNESDSDTKEGDFSNVSSNESDYSGDTEIAHNMDNSYNLSTSGWQTNIKELSSIEFTVNSVDETNKFSKFIFEKSKMEPSLSKLPELLCSTEVTRNEKERLVFCQYIPYKHHDMAKKFINCNPNSGYNWNCFVYAGKDAELTELDALYGERIVKTLLADLENKVYNLYLDRFPPFS